MQVSCNVNCAIIISYMVLFSILIKNCHTSGVVLENDLFYQPHTGKFRDTKLDGVARQIAEDLHNIYKENASFVASDRLFSLSVGLPDESRAAINYAAGCLISCENRCICPEITNYTKMHRDNWKKEIPTLNVDFFQNFPEVLYFHHGLRFASDNIRKYVSNKIFLDIGAYLGDSAYALAKYHPYRIYSYDITATHIQAIAKNAKKYGYENVTIPKYLGISSKPGTIKVPTGIGAGYQLGNLLGMKGDEVNITTIDIESKDMKRKIGFIKADVEGIAVDVLEGAIDTIRRDRPILQISVYHRLKELFGVPEFIRQFPNYIIDFHSENDKASSMCEAAIFAYPAEIQYEIYNNKLI